MPQLELTLETVTPLFLAGADARGTPELRPPAFRGAMRYWLRAALGGVIGDNNLDALHKLESAVMGNTDFGSPIQLRLQGSLESSNYKILPHKEGREAGQRKAFNAKQVFNLTMRQLRTSDEAIWQMACSALQLALLFGGIGLRSRRGFGTLRITNSSDPKLIKSMPQSLPEWEKYVTYATSQAMTVARHLAVAQKVPTINLPKGPTRFPCANQSGMIWICDLDAKDGVDAVRQLMAKTRNDSAFGGIGREYRQASPLWVRVIPLDDKYGLLCTVVASNFKGSDYRRVREFLDGFEGNYIQAKGWNV